MNTSTSTGNPKIEGEAADPGRFSRRSRLVLVGFFCTSGVAISLLLYWNLHLRQQQLVQARFNLDAQQRVAAIEEHLVARLSEVRSLAAFYAGSERVERDEFHTFAEQILADDSAVKMLGWMKRIPDSQRQAHEESMAGELGEEYRIVEWGAEESLVVAGKRDEYFPSFYRDGSGLHLTQPFTQHAHRLILIAGKKRRIETGLRGGTVLCFCYHQRW